MRFAGGEFLFAAVEIGEARLFDVALRANEVGEETWGVEAERGEELASAGPAALVLLAREAAREFVLIEGDLGRRVESAGRYRCRLISGVRDLVVGCAEDWKDRGAVATVSRGARESDGLVGRAFTGSTGHATGRRCV
ncbi:hypothetical protein ABZ326_18610 [Streptomyces californicus]|uniref:hypothetical protein n=1 Tax=Streptomyces californicus TaxID=67351 RepID=UPI0034D96AD8